jgi:hypothetical protein
MTKIIVFLGALFTTACYSQEKLNPLTKPTSPAASILGMQPSVMLQPKSYRSLEVALYSNFSDGNGNTIIPNDFGLEFMPYWAVNRGISLEDYLYPKTGFLQVIRNSSFSVATTQKFLLQDSTETKSIALGYRTSLFFGNTNDEKKIIDYIKTTRTRMSINTDVLKAINKIKENDSTSTKDDYIKEIKRILPDLIYKELKTKTRKEVDVIAEKIYSDLDELPFDLATTDTFFTSVIDAVTETVGGNYSEFKTYITNRQGFAVDLATAIHLNFPDNNLNFSEVPKYSIWLSPSYNFSKELQFLKASATLRYEHFYIDYFKKYFPDSNVFENNIDYGLSVSGNFKKFSIEFEATGRNSQTLIEAGQDIQGNTLYRKESSSDTQYIGTFSYRLTEQIALSYQLGSAFKPVFNVNGGTLISLLSLNLGFGGPDKNDITSKSSK